MEDDENTDMSEGEVTTDLDALLEEAIEQLQQEETLDGEEEGPTEEEGELNLEDAPADGEPSDESDEDEGLVEDAEDLEDEDPDELDDPESDDEGEEPESSEPPKEDPRVRELEQQLAETREQFQQLVQLVKGGAVPPQQQQPRFDPVLANALYAYHTGDAETLEKFDPAVRRQAAEVVRREQESAVRYTLDPQARYQEQIAPFVKQAIQSAIQPFIREREENQFQQLIARHSNVLEGEKDYSRLSQILKDVPRGDSNSLEDAEKRLKVAVKLLLSEKQSGKAAKREQKLKTKERQQRARKAQRRGTKQRRRKDRTPELPKVSNPDDMFSDEHLAAVERFLKEKR